MIDTLVEPGDRLARRLAQFRAANPGPGTIDDPLPYRPNASRDLARRLADAVDGEVVDSGGGVHVRVETAGIELPLDRGRLAALPGQPPADRPLVCLDTETTGLATAAGTVAFLIGLGWWDGHGLSPGPAAAAGPRGGGRAPRPAQRPHPARRVARDVQRPRLRLAAARDPIPARTPRRARITPATSICCRSSVDCSGIGWMTRASGPSSARSSASSVTTTSTAGRSPAAISGSSVAARPSRWPRSSATTTRTSARSARLLVHIEQGLGDPGQPGKRAPRRPGRAGARLSPGAAARRGAWTASMRRWPPTRRRRSRSCHRLRPRARRWTSRGGRRGAGRTSVVDRNVGRACGWDQRQALRPALGRGAHRRRPGTPAPPPRAGRRRARGMGCAGLRAGPDGGPRDDRGRQAPGAPPRRSDRGPGDASSGAWSWPTGGAPAACRSPRSRPTCATAGGDCAAGCWCEGRRTAVAV